MNKRIVDMVAFLLVVLFAIFVGVVGVVRFTGTDLLSETMIRTNGGRITVNLFYILLGVVGMYLLGMFTLARMQEAGY